LLIKGVVVFSSADLAHIADLALVVVEAMSRDQGQNFKIEQNGRSLQLNKKISVALIRFYLEYALHEG
jgi:hypothetical protein